MRISVCVCVRVYQFGSVSPLCVCVSVMCVRACDCVGLPVCQQRRPESAVVTLSVATVTLLLQWSEWQVAASLSIHEIGCIQIHIP